MTTPAFNAIVGPRARAIDAIKTRHNDKAGYGPAAPAVGSVRCPKCKGTIKYTVEAGGTGLCSGTCSTTHCLKWSLV